MNPTLQQLQKLTDTKPKREEYASRIIGKSIRIANHKKMIGIMKLIRICQSRINIEINVAMTMYGISNDGFPMVNEAQRKNIDKNKAIIERLKKYYNNKLFSLNSFVI